MRVVRLAAPEEGSGDRPDTRSARQRAVDVLEARIGATARDEAVGESDLDSRLQAYKAAVTKQGDGHAENDRLGHLRDLHDRVAQSHAARCRAHPRVTRDRERSAVPPR